MGSEYAQLRIVFRRHSALGSLCLAGFFLIGLTVWVIVAHYPLPDLIISVAMTVVLWSLIGRAAFRRPTMLEGTRLVRRGVITTRRCDLTEARHIKIYRCWNRVTYLNIYPPKSRVIYLPLIILNGITDGAVTPDQLDCLIGILQSLKTSIVERTVFSQLTAQAEHLRNGGTLADSPLLVR